MAIGDHNFKPFIHSSVIKKFICSYCQTKACGADGIHTKLLAHLVDTRLPDHLSLLFQACCLTGLTPRRWNDTTVYPLPKKANAETIADCRPISLTVMFRRIFEHCLLKFVWKHPSCSTLRSFHSSQGGFIPGNSCLLHAATSGDACTSNRRACAGGGGCSSTSSASILRQQVW